ncbi:MAG: hypothetical protein FD181_3815 [Prolixibacteraceae bacterium]|nr:MAG: hypothetical protein FD181_3815 [Prolixibacteraceae bacterium]
MILLIGSHCLLVNLNMMAFLTPFDYAQVDSMKRFLKVTA